MSDRELVEEQMEWDPVRPGRYCGADAARAAAPLDVEDLIRRLQAPPYHWNERITHDLRAVVEDARRG